MFQVNLFNLQLVFAYVHSTASTQPPVDILVYSVYPTAYTRSINYL